MKIRSVAENLLESITPCNTTVVKGSGSISDPYVICSVAQFEQLETYYGSYIAIGKDLDFTNSGFEGIRNSFLGNIDGRNHTLTGFQTTDQTRSRVALFSQLEPDSTIENLVLDGFKVSGSGMVAGVVGMVNGSAGHPVVLKNIVVKNSVFAAQSIVSSLISRGSYVNISDITIQNTQIVGPVAPGLLSGFLANSSISDVHVEGQVVGAYYVGGLIGYSSGNTVSKAAVYASVNMAEDSASYNDNGEAGFAGGFFGVCQTNQVSKSYFIGELVSHSTNPIDSMGEYCGVASNETVSEVYLGARTAYDVTGAAFNLNGIFGTDGNPGGSSFSNVYIYDHNYMFPNEQSTGVSDLSFSQMNTFSSFSFAGANWKAATATAFRFPILTGQTSSEPFADAQYSSSKSLPLVVIETEVHGYAFDETARGSSYLSTFVVKNLGSTPVYLDSISTGGLMNGSFVMESGAGAGTCAGVMSGGLALTQNQSCTVGVRVVPDHVLQTGVIYDALNIAYRIGNVKQKVLHGLDAPIKVVRPYVYDDSVSFSTLIVGLTDSQDYTIQNNGDDAGTIVSYSLPSTVFTLDDTDCPVGTILNVNDTCDLHFNFAPTVVGSYSANLTITMQDSNGFQYTTIFSISGSGINRPFNADTSAGCQAADGSVAHPYCVSTAAELEDVRNFNSKKFILTADIDLNGVNWVPINNFSGVIDGDSHVISNVSVSVGGYGGFIGDLSGTVKNLTIHNVSISSTGTYTGALVGIAYGSISHVTINGTCTVSGPSYTGGLVGYATSTSALSYVSTNCVVTGSGDAVGGLVGRLDAAMDHAYASGNVSNTDGYRFTGGLIGQLATAGTIADCGASGNVVAGTEPWAGNTEAGSFVGAIYSGALITRSYATGDIDAATLCTGACYGSGGFAGSFRNGRISKVFASGNVIGIYRVGGLVGVINADVAGNEIEDSYFIGTVNGVAETGGLVGYGGGTIVRSYIATTSIVSSGGTPYYIDGIDGMSLTDVYYLNNGAGTANSTGATAIVLANIETQGSFVNFDFTTPVWKMPSANPGASKLSPVLAWQCGSNGVVCP